MVETIDRSPMAAASVDRTIFALIGIAIRRLRFFCCEFDLASGLV